MRAKPALVTKTVTLKPMIFSIITVVRNAAERVTEALHSVAAQSGPTVEHILIDGASTDDTLSLLTAYRERMQARTDRRVRLVSEPDEGMYDALNKGIDLATGDVIGILHADDRYAAPNVISKVASVFEAGDADAVYGDLAYVKNEASGRIVRYWRSGAYRPQRLKYGWMPPHPTLFVKRSVYARLKRKDGRVFDPSFTIAADYDFMLRMLTGHQVQPVYLPEVLVKMRLGGASNRSPLNMLRKSREDLQVMRRHRVGGVLTLAAKNLRKIPQFLLKYPAEL